MGYRITTAPTSSPVTVAQAKAQTAIDTSAEDARIQSYIDAAVNWIELVTWRALVTQTITLQFDAWPDGDTLWLPKPRLQDVTSVTYQDANNDEQTLDAGDYLVDTGGEVGRLCLGRFASWPALYGNPFGDVTVTYTAGYGDADAVPAAIKQAILMLVAKWEFDREVGEIPKGAEALIGPFRIRKECLLEYYQ